MAKSAYAFFVQKAESNEYFTLMDIVQATNYEEGTAKSYTGKKWRSFLIESGDGYYCHKPDCSEEEFVKGHSQKWEPSGQGGGSNVDDYQEQKSTLPQVVTPEPAIIDAYISIDENQLYKWLLLLIIVSQWYKISGKYKAKLWRILLSIVQYYKSKGDVASM